LAGKPALSEVEGSARPTQPAPKLLIRESRGFLKNLQEHFSRELSGLRVLV
jgi:hypothetical protein